MLRYVGLVQPGFFDEVRHRVLTHHQSVQDAEPGGLGQNAKTFRDESEGFGGELLRHERHEEKIY